MSVTDARIILDRLVDERGGVEKLSMADLAIARAAARILASDDLGARSAQSAASLVEMLPPPLPRLPMIAPIEGAKPPDLSLLSDKQLHDLDALMSIATGIAAPEPYSKRRNLADELAVLLDNAETDDPPPNHVGAWCGRRIPESETLRLQIHNALSSLLYPLYLPRVFGIEELAARLRVAERTARDAEDRALRAEHKLSLAASGSDARANVVPIRRIPNPGLAPGLHSGGTTSPLPGACTGDIPSNW